MWCARKLLQPNVKDISPQNQHFFFFISPVVLFINLKCFGLRCPVLEMLAAEVAAFTQIQPELKCILVILKAPKNWKIQKESLIRNHNPVMLDNILIYLLRCFLKRDKCIKHNFIQNRCYAYRFLAKAKLQPLSLVRLLQEKFKSKEKTSTATLKYRIYKNKMKTETKAKMQNW